jgi:L-rhamnose isomerase
MHIGLTCYLQLYTCRYAQRHELAEFPSIFESVYDLELLSEIHLFRATLAFCTRIPWDHQKSLKMTVLQGLVECR